MHKSNSNQSKQTEKTVPESSREWFQLIKPEIEVEPEEASSDIVCQHARKHAEQVIERTDMDVNIDHTEWKASRRLRTCHGRARWGEIKLSLKSLKHNGWCSLMETVRHELIHIWQFQQFKEGGHGESFEKWMDVLNVAKSSGQVLPQWKLKCSKCGSEFITRTDKTEKELSRTVQKDRSYYCNNCRERTEIRIERDGEDVSIDELPDIPAPTETDQHVFLYNTTTEDSSLAWDPETANLIDFPGIGEATAEAIGSEIHAIDDLLSDGELDPDIRPQIPTRHNELEAELIDLSETVLEQRSEEDLDLLEQARHNDPRNWWRPMINIGDDQKLVKIQKRIREGIEEDTRCEFRLRNHEETYRGTVTPDFFTRIVFDQEIPRMGEEAHLSAGDSNELPRLQFHDAVESPAQIDITGFEIIDPAE